MDDCDVADALLKPGVLNFCLRARLLDKYHGWPAVRNLRHQASGIQKRFVSAPVLAQQQRCPPSVISHRVNAGPLKSLLLGRSFGALSLQSVFQCEHLIHVEPARSRDEGEAELVSHWIALAQYFDCIVYRILYA